MNNIEKTMEKAGEISQDFCPVMHKECKGVIPVMDGVDENGEINPRWLGHPLGDPERRAAVSFLIKEKLYTKAKEPTDTALREGVFSIQKQRGVDTWGDNYVLLLHLCAYLRHALLKNIVFLKGESQYCDDGEIERYIRHHATPTPVSIIGNSVSVRNHSNKPSCEVCQSKVEALLKKQMEKTPSKNWNLPKLKVVE